MACFVFYKFYYCPECVDEELLMPCISGMNWDVELNVISSLLIFSRLILPLGVFSTSFLVKFNAYITFIKFVQPFFNICHNWDFKKSSDYKNILFYVIDCGRV